MLASVPPLYPFWHPCLDAMYSAKPAVLTLLGCLYVSTPSCPSCMCDAGSGDPKAVERAVAAAEKKLKKTAEEAEKKATREAAAAAKALEIANKVSALHCCLTLARSLYTRYR